MLMSVYKYCIVPLLLLAANFALAQQAPIQNYAVDGNGCVRLTVNSAADKYYVLQVRHHPDSAFALSTSLTLGQAGQTVVTEPLRAYPATHYRVLEYGAGSPFDTDGDGWNDMAEYNAMPYRGPLNAAPPIPVEHGLTTLNTVSAFHTMATDENGTPWVEYLNGMEYTKFMILDFYTAPKIYFVNSNTYSLHLDFANYLGTDYWAPTTIKGQLIFHPTVMAANGTLGTYSFNFTNNEAKPFSVVRRTQELLAANMPFLGNNLSYFITANNEPDYQNNLPLYQNSRVPVVFENDVYAGLDYWGLNRAEGYGFFRLMAPGETPDSRDIVLYEVLPNALPRVGGIITSAMQTPLSHVNLRAIHYQIPNAFIRDPLANNAIAGLLGHYIYFRAGQSGYEIREATLDEVNAWYENMRPATEQSPPLNVSYRDILPLDQITFGMYDGFGAKTANVATMRSFGFAPGTVPDGFGVPFYFYQEFMRHNNFFVRIEAMLKDPDFVADRTVREAQLHQLRADIKAAGMPPWMWERLSALQGGFADGTSIRCRSSTNNEDLPGFSGAGLYDSKTHHPDEGHIAKTIKQVYASLWNLRAFEEREFNRVNHLMASMGVLCHPNFEDEKVNGVGISADPVYETDGTFYLNSQLGEELITNPGSTYPEELLLKRQPDGNAPGYSVVRYSSLVPGDSLLMTAAQLDQLRQYLAVIHDRFAVLYGAVGNPTFAMDIEYKIDSGNRLSIKQARPWVSYVPTPKPTVVAGDCNLVLFPNPAADVVTVACENCETDRIVITDLRGFTVFDKPVGTLAGNQVQVPIDHLKGGIYVLSGTIGKSVCKSVKLVKAE